jgi:chemosensory pili system protein ChpC|tara:strand:- start:32083 stop:32535 length:453 start_codon:yes stop_codon:yes gene_type:complete
MSTTFPLGSTIAICDGFNMLLPSNLIADVFSAVSIDQKSGAQPWSIGDISWRGLHLPVISIEQIILHRAPRLRGSHVAILHGTVDTEKMPFFGVPLQAMPHNFNLENQRDVTQRSDHLELDFCAMKVTARGVSAVIPQLEAIENLLLENS